MIGKNPFHYHMTFFASGLSWIPTRSLQPFRDRVSLRSPKRLRHGSWRRQRHRLHGPREGPLHPRALPIFSQAGTSQVRTATAAVCDNADLQPRFVVNRTHLLLPLFQKAKPFYHFIKNGPAFWNCRCNIWPWFQEPSSRWCSSNRVTPCSRWAVAIRYQFSQQSCSKS